MLLVEAIANLYRGPIVVKGVPEARPRRQAMEMDIGTSSTAIEDKSGNNRKDPSWKCPAHVREEIQDYMLKKVAAKDFDKTSFPDFEDVERMGDDEDKDEIGANIEVPQKGSKDRKNAKLKQTTINVACKKELREKACRDIARWMYDVAIPFNAANYPSFQVMLESIGQFGIGLKAPSYHELRVPLLNKEVTNVKNELKSYEEEWAKYGCSIMADGWTDKKQSTLINFLVNSLKGTVFLESVDTSKYSKIGEKMFERFDRIVERVGEANVVQVVTDNASNCVLAGKLLQVKHPHLYWTPCAAHCLDLILEDIGKMPKFHNTIKRAVTMNGYIYVRPGVVNMLRHFTGERELIRLAVTRFATAFLTLQCINKHKTNLRKMFTSEEWTISKWAKEQAVRVLRLIDGEKRPAMGYIYEAMDRAKEAIAKSFGKKEEKYKAIAADEEVMTGLYTVLQRLIPTQQEQDKIMKQLLLYQNSVGIFRMPVTIRNRTAISPAEWWNAYGASTPDLRNFTIKIHSKKRNRLAQQRLNDLVFVKYNQALRHRYDACHCIDPISLKDIDDSNEWLMGQMEEELENDELVFEDDNLTWNAVVEAIGVEEDAYNTRSGKEKNIASVVASRSMSKHKGKPPSRADTPLLREETSSEEDEDIDFEEDEYEEDEAEGEDKEDLNATFDID
ncbi:uncharacterized protein LOC110645315 [Hevea brasiliensis]|uniref:uncharacterized protein LOC110645315 n=1 Tax=Hevea brasiliensis TaxID=3981 RepID=UPI0025F7A087|nr:uncharacterized protein LOC110645315 [Hevea brasiliensis]